MSFCFHKLAFAWSAFMVTACSSGPSGDGLPPDGGDVDAIPVACAASFESLVGTDDVTLVEGPFACGNSDSSTVSCGVWKARIEVPDAADGPLDDPSLDDDLQAANILLAVRWPLGATPCDTQWITFDSGGTGRGYAQTFGGVSPGTYVVGGNGYGDDLIAAYNALGYATVDIVWECSGNATSGCGGTAYADWVPVFSGGSGWAHLTGGTGYVGVSSRSNVVYEWAHANAGKRLCGHAHSSGTGRMMGTLTRYGGDKLFDTVVLDGGPVWAYIPWYCGVDVGPLGPITTEFAISSGALFTGLYDCARSPGDNNNTCSYQECTQSRYDESAYLADSNFYRATDRDFDLDMHIILGGQDLSPAPPHARLWLSGYDSVPGISANGLTLTQGYCGSTNGTYGAGRQCTDWAASGFPGIGGSDIGYDARLVDVTHATASHAEALDVLVGRMTSTCGP